MNLGHLRFFFLILFFSNNLSSEPLQMRYAKFKVLDKISNKLIEKTISVNGSENIETLNIEVYACFTEPPDEISEDYVLINVKDNLQNEYSSSYIGWMISSSPTATPLEHPIYDVWVSDCKIGNDS